MDEFIWAALWISSFTLEAQIPTSPCPPIVSVTWIKIPCWCLVVGFIDSMYWCSAPVCVDAMSTWWISVQVVDHHPKGSAPGTAGPVSPIPVTVCAVTHSCWETPKISPVCLGTGSCSGSAACVGNLRKGALREKQLPWWCSVLFVTLDKDRISSTKRTQMPHTSFCFKAWFSTAVNNTAAHPGLPRVRIPVSVELHLNLGVYS